MNLGIKNKIFCVVMLSVFFMTMLVVFVGCSEDNVMEVAHFSDMSSVGSKAYSVKVVIDEESKLKNKSIDVQILSSVSDLEIAINLEGQSPKNISLPKENRWYSLTEFFAEEKVEFTKFETAENLQYILKVNKSADVSFRVVAGEAVEASDGGQLLANSEMISNIFTKKMEKFE